MYHLSQGLCTTAPVFQAAPGLGIFTCHVCRDCFSSQDYLDEHVSRCHAERPQGKLQCSYCPYTSDFRKNITRHERTHTGDRPFSCTACDRRFAVKEHLQRHQRTHTGEKPYKCTDCGQHFSDISCLTKHKSRLHSTEENTHMCHYCGNTFREKSYLLSHLAIHTGERKYPCHVCGKTFAFSGAARRHERAVHAVQYPPQSDFPSL